MVTQRVIIPGGTDRTTSPPISRTTFGRMSGRARIPLGKSAWVLRAECFWDEKAETISVFPRLGGRYG